MIKKLPCRFFENIRSFSNIKIVMKKVTTETSFSNAIPEESVGRLMVDDRLESKHCYSVASSLRCDKVKRVCRRVLFH